MKRTNPRQRPSMRKQIQKIYRRLLVLLHLSPLSLAEKVRVTFGAAVLLCLALALLIPYTWMQQLTKQISLDAGRAKTETLLRSHFQIKRPAETALAQLDSSGAALDVNRTDLRWIRFEKDDEQLTRLSDTQKEIVEELTDDEENFDQVRFEKKEGMLYSSYVRIFRANDSCISCHNPQGSAGAFNRNEPVGLVIIERPAADIARAMLLNSVWIVVAGLIGGAGAIVAFYVITQRVILRPIRQLRALANNVAEGNLDTRSSIRTRDEYEKLANAFNHMLDSLQSAQEKLRQANKQLDAKISELSGRNIELFKANKLKSEFLANISHEFRTPLNAILGFAQVLRDKPEILKKEKGQRYAENIITGGQRLMNMINDLLHLAKTEAGKVRLHIEQFDLHDLCKSVVASFSGMTREKKVKTKLVVADAVPPLCTDAGKVQQILYNFLSNAVNFTPQRGRIEIRAQMLDEKNVRISVCDTGCGIAEEDKERIFEKFRQAGGSLTRPSAGSGLGLAISKELADMLAGRIGMESTAGRGSTFWFDIPVTLASSEETESESQA